MICRSQKASPLSCTTGDEPEATSRCDGPTPMFKTTWRGSGSGSQGTAFVPPYPQFETPILRLLGWLRTRPLVGSRKEAHRDEYDAKRCGEG
jgi:hypothetical protein